MTLQQDEPEDYVIATGQSHFVRDLLQVAFQPVGIEAWRLYVVQDEPFSGRPTSSSWWATPARPGRSSAGSRRRLPAADRDDGRRRPQEREAQPRVRPESDGYQHRALS
jgi:hypothetical protein